MSVVQQGQNDSQHIDIQLNDTQHYNNYFSLSIKTITTATQRVLSVVTLSVVMLNVMAPHQSLQ